MTKGSLSMNLEKNVQVKQPKYQQIAVDLASKIVEKNIKLAIKFMQDLHWLANTMYRLKRQEER